MFVNYLGQLSFIHLVTSILGVLVLEIFQFFSNGISIRTRISELSVSGDESSG